MMNWRDKLKELMEQAEQDSYDQFDENEPQIIVVPREDQDSLFKLLAELGFNTSEPDAIDKQIAELMDAGKCVVFADVESIH